MGAELGQHREWSHESSVDWHLLEDPAHAGLQRWVRDLNTCYRGEPALHEADCDPAGFAWIDCHDSQQSTLSFLRRARSGAQEIAVVCNFTPVPRQNYRVGVPHSGRWRELLNSDATLYGGSGQGNLGGVRTDPVPAHGQLQSLTLTLPPLAIVLFERQKS
jgi:1,4-alpha-glucan branching enzyme